jgi:predicted Zn-dependent protease
MRTWVALHPEDAAAWEALGQLEARLGRRLAAWRAQAEARFALGDWNGALEQLRAASRFARQSGQGDSIDAVVIDARLKVVDERRRRQLLEEGRNPDDPRENGSQR